MVYNSERLICETIDQKTFFKAMRDNGYSEEVLTNLFDEDNFESIDQCDFNGVIRNINKTDRIPIFDMLMYLEKNIAEVRKIYPILDDRNKAILTEEAKKTFHIKISECSLSDFFNG